MSDGHHSELGTVCQQYFAELLRLLEKLPAEQQPRFAREYLKEKAATLSADEYEGLIVRLRQQMPDLKGDWESPSAEPATVSFLMMSMDSTATETGSTDRSRPPVNSLRGTFVGRYRIDEPLGVGGFGEVWKGFDPELNRPVAIKLGRRDRQFSEPILTRFLVEAQKAASMSHAGIVQVYDIARVADGYVIVSEFIDGETLSQRLKRGPVSIDFAVATVIAVAEALHHAHIRDIVHRDVKPGNILLRSNDAAVLGDFGLAISERELIGQSNNLSGTIRYMSPEQARGEGIGIDHRSDLFSLGLVLYEMLAGRMPYPDGDSDSYLRAVASRAPRPLGSVKENLPAGLEQICMKCLAFSPEARYATCRELADVLSEWRQNSRIDHSSSTQLMLQNPAVTRRRQLILASALVGGIVLAGVVLFRMKPYNPSPAVGKLPAANPVQQNKPNIQVDNAAPPAKPQPGPGPAPTDVLPILTLTDTWTPLMKEMPQVVTWGTSDGREPPRFDRPESRLSVKSPRSRWVFQCADIESQPFQVRTVLSVDRWEGYAGIVWGLREDPAAFPDVHYQCLSVEYLCGGPQETAKLVARSMVLKRYGFDDLRIIHSASLAEQVIPRPTESELPFEVEIGLEGPNVKLGAGQRWQARDILRGTVWLPPGKWAVGLTGKGQGVSLRSLSIRNLSRANP